MFNFLVNIKLQFLPWFNLAKRLYELSKQWIILPLLVTVISGAVVTRLYNGLRGPSSYKIYIVGNIQTEFIRDIISAFNPESRTGLKIDGVEIEFVQINAKEKEADRISSKLTSLNDTLAIIGHFTSTASSQALPNYLGAEPPVPVILPTETNPDIIPATNKKKFSPVFRLSPTDDKQAEKISEFLFNKSAKGIWVIEDTTSNPVYSKFLIQSLLRRINEQSLAFLKKKNIEYSELLEKKLLHKNFDKKPLTFPGSMDNANLPHIVLWTHNTMFPSTDTLEMLGVNWVFFAGDSANCLIVLNQVSELNRELMKINRKVKTIFGNACASQDILNIGSSDSNSIFLAHNMLAKEYNDNGYERRGHQLFSLVQQIISGTNTSFTDYATEHISISENLMFHVRRLLDWHDVRDARNAISSYMSTAVLKAFEFNLEKDIYIFDSNGTVIQQGYHLWMVKSLREMESSGKYGKFIDLDPSE